MSTFIVKAITREFYKAEIEAETEEDAWEKANAFPYDEWEKDEDAVFSASPDYQFEVTSVEEDC